jgi:hypothetical protein
MKYAVLWLLGVPVGGLILIWLVMKLLFGHG